MKSRKLLLNVLMIAVCVTCFSLGTAHAVVPDLVDWADTWFKVKLTRVVYQFSDTGVKPDPSYPLPESMGSTYLHITGWDQGTETLTADIYRKDHNTGQWVTTPFATIGIQYFAGTALKFIGSAQLETPNDVTMSLVFYFKGKKDWNDEFILWGITNVSTMASSMLEIDDAPGSTERWAGSAMIIGPMVRGSSVPFTPTE